jgi:hypothetical protein
MNNAAFAASNRSHSQVVLSAISGAGGTEDQGAGTRVDAPTEQTSKLPTLVER